MFRKENGFTVPESDIECCRVVFDSVIDLKYAYTHCKAFDVVVQAGGNFGVWPAALAAKFKTVYTFEPDPVNFSCLCRNIGDTQNIIKIQAALGESPQCVELVRAENNAGAHYIEGAGNLPVLRLDDLGLPACDLIVLDIEGYELNALKGAIKTITRFSPVIHIEDKWLCTKYGSNPGDVVKWLESMGYKVVATPGRDVVLCK